MTSKQRRQEAAALEKKRTRRKVSETEYLTKMHSTDNAVEFEDLHTCFYTDGGIVRSVGGISFDVPMGKTVAVVGESGCGKSVTSLSLMQLLQRPQGQITQGQIRLNLGDKAYDIARTPEYVMRRLRGGVVSMIFQEPMTALNPVLRIGEQVAEAVTLHSSMDSKQAKARALELLELVGIADSRGVYNRYPHALSGGMRQRVVIAMALASDPKLIVADEPTTALDVTIQAQILELLKSIKEKTGCAILLITHDLGVVAGMADHVVVMYAGRVVEKGTAEEIFYHPAHPYTIGLMRAKPVVGKRNERLYTISGTLPDPMDMPTWCYFRERCENHCGQCDGEYPAQIHLSATHSVSCYRCTGEDDHGKEDG